MMKHRLPTDKYQYAAALGAAKAHTYTLAAEWVDRNLEKTPNELADGLRKRAHLAENDAAEADGRASDLDPDGMIAKILGPYET